MPITCIEQRIYDTYMHVYGYIRSMTFLQVAIYNLPAKDIASAGGSLEHACSCSDVDGQ